METKNCNAASLRSRINGGRHHKEVCSRSTIRAVARHIEHDGQSISLGKPLSKSIHLPDVVTTRRAKADASNAKRLSN